MTAADPLKEEAEEDEERENAVISQDGAGRSYEAYKIMFIL